MTTPSRQRTVNCPTCDKQVVWSERQRWKPFCSERCKLIDLGAWFNETNRIPGKPGGNEPGHD
jgi:endogenous inhibitor of DNA gyrase (YacG/DUF329 family)